MRTIVSVRMTLLISAFLLFSSAAKTQSLSVANGKLEIGAGIGPMFFLGDLGGSSGKGTTFLKDVDLPLTKLNKGLYINVYPTEWLGLRLAGNISYLQGDDAQAPNKGGGRKISHTT